MSSTSRVRVESLGFTLKNLVRVQQFGASSPSFPVFIAFLLMIFLSFPKNVPYFKKNIFSVEDNKKLNYIFGTFLFILKTKISLQRPPKGVQSKKNKGEN